ncbi:MAG: hypothetical protein HYS13_15135 [Planctomycetia bacterium]|nr:hypothetical protein [Planctomycetia bacterium]
MSQAAQDDSPSRSASQGRAAGFPAQAWIETLLIFCVFALHGAWLAPEVNESHYLCKAKHYWDPEWLKGDFFLGSADAHATFYWAAGWLTKVMSLPAAAWTGRAVTWLLLAWTWRRLAIAILPRPLWAVLSATALLLLNEYGELAGEWVVGGFEAKGLAYVFVLAALERLVRGRWNAAIVLLGGAAFLHVLAGGWMIVSLLLAWLMSPRRSSASDEGGRPRLVSLLPALAVAIVLSLPSLIPAVRLSWGAPADVVAEANRIYVFERLGHHLDPRQFPIEKVVAHLLLLAWWAVLYWRIRGDERLRLLGSVVFGAVVISAAGGVIAAVANFAPHAGAALLRYYWFRTADALVPLGAALAAVFLLARLWDRRPTTAAWLLTAALAVAAIHFGTLWYQRRTAPWPRCDLRETSERYAAWRDVCRDIREHAPREAVFITPLDRQTFHWYAQRREVFNSKDIPQDAASIVEWNRRWDALDPPVDPPPSFSLARRPLKDLRAAARRYGASHLVTESEPRLPLPLFYGNAVYAVYVIGPIAKNGVRPRGSPTPDADDQRPND